ncbi:MAG: arsenic metallochaperone ArsD family protein, partial [Anaerolineales bacterium]|nr:arsenic metallochaperone ArsD family protein [Anaerolineales bacterium]
SEMILSLQGDGVSVNRYQMTSHPQAFMGNAEVMRLVRAQQMAALPITVVHGQVLRSGAYPSLAEVRAALAGSAA